jgi:ABC-type polysaccharide/polyol phosphate transport system ATPase subunit
MTSFQSIFEFITKIPSPDDFWVLNDISFSLKAGESLGILGANGSGKSTLLKILARVTPPTKGSTNVVGKIGALIEIGAGLNPELTGRENIFLYGAILGMPKRMIRERFDDIVEFSGLAHALDTPAKFYSSGMFLRLGFSVTVHMDPDILIIDEALAVGDGAFQEKCFRRMEEFQRQGKILILVSHDMGMIERYTTRCLVLKTGVVIKQGTPHECIEQYLKTLLNVE